MATLLSTIDNDESKHKDPGSSPRYIFMCQQLDLELHSRGLTGYGPMGSPVFNILVL